MGLTKNRVIGICLLILWLIGIWEQGLVSATILLGYYISFLSGLTLPLVLIKAVKLKIFPKEVFGRLMIIYLPAFAMTMLYIKEPISLIISIPLIGAAGGVVLAIAHYKGIGTNA